MGCRHKTQRSNRVRLKADAHHLLRLMVEDDGRTIEQFRDEITEMQTRLQPKRGVAAPIILTGYTKESN